MHISALDIKGLARERGAHQPSHPLLPPPIIAFTQYWLKLAEGRTPTWASFDMMDVAEAAPYLTILKVRGESACDLEFVGSGMTAIIGEDITGQRVTESSPIVGDVNWFERAKVTVDRADIHVDNGTINPEYTSEIEYVSADFPFSDDTGAVTHVICITVAKLN